MKRLIAFVFVSLLAAAQTGPHRKLYSGGSGFNCSAFTSSGINEAETDGEIFFSSPPTVTMHNAFLAGDQMLAVANWSGGNSVTNPTLNDTRVSTWNPIIVQPNVGIWYATTGAFSNDVLTVNFNGFFELSVNWSLTVVHLNGSVLPSIIGPPGATGIYPATPSFALNASTVTFGFSGATSENWFFGGVGSPSTATYGHGLVVAGITSLNGANYGSVTPSPWTSIILSELPNTQLVYACS